jgi:small GTP-binding protein
MNIKCVFLGKTNTGKTCLVTRFAKDYFDQFTSSTVGAAFAMKKLKILNNNITLEIWDTVGQERFESLSKMYYRGAKVVVIVFDTREESYERAQNWVNTIMEYSEDTTILLLGNKCDLVDTRNLIRYEEYAESKNIIFYECSAKTGTNVNESIHMAIKNYLRKIKYSGFELSEPALNLNDVNKKKKKNLLDGFLWSRIIKIIIIE